MAIIACKECGHQVSDKAASCPSCGAPIAVVVKPRRRARRVIYGVLITSAALALIAAMLLLIRMPNRGAGTVGGFNHGAEHFPAGDSSAERSVATDQASRETGAIVGAIYQTTAEQLYQDYGTNAVATQNRIGNSRVRVTGSVTEIDEDALGHPIVKLWASDGQSVAMMLNDDQKSAAADLAKGEAVDIQCDKMQATAATPQGSGCAVVLVDATSKQAYLAVFFSGEKGIAPVYIVGPMSKAACLARSDGISAQLTTDLKRDHVVSKNCTATARDSIPPQGCHLSSSMSSLPDMPAAHLWRYDCVAPSAASRRATETATTRHKSSPGVVVMSIPAAPDVSSELEESELEEAAPTSAAAAIPGHAAAAQPAIPQAPVAETQKSAPSVAATNVSPAPPAPPAPPASPAPPAPPAPVKTPDSAGTAIPNDLLDVKVADPGAADHIATYCNTATAGAANQPSVAAGCRHEEVSAWTRLVLHNEFPTLDDATRQKCNEPPFPDSYVAKETCAKYQLRIN